MHSEMLHSTASSSSSATDDKDKQLSSFNVSKQMAEFQKVVDDYQNYQNKTIFSPVNSPTPPSPAPPAMPPPPTLLLSDEDGILHPEVGIDHELERLLAENPGLFMTDTEDNTEKMMPQRRR